METSRCKKGPRAYMALVISVLGILMIFMYYGDQQNCIETVSCLMNKNDVGISRSTMFSSGTSGAKLSKQIMNDDNDDVEFMKEQAEIQRLRHKVLKAACKENNISSVPQEGMGNATSSSRIGLLVDRNHKLVYCPVPKIASTTWRLVFERLAGLINFKEYDQGTTNKVLSRKLTHMNDIPRLDAARLMNESVSFLFARHPFSRILSSYRNKLEPSSTFERAYLWQSIIGESIIKLYRSNIDKLRGNKNKKEIYRRWRNYKKRNISQSYDLTFPEFVRYLGDEDNKKAAFIDNIHWIEVAKQCTPCSIRYDVIGKLETVEDDAKYILKLANLDRRVNFPSPNISSPTFSFRNDVLTQYLKDVPAEYLRDLYKRYLIDFELFGYDLPPFAGK